MIEMMVDATQMAGAILLQAIIAAAAIALAALLWPALRQVLPRILPLCLTIAVIWLWATALINTADRQAPAYMLQDIPIASQARSVVLGRAELMQNPGLGGSADERHVQLARDGSNWTIANISARRHLRLEYINGAGNAVELDSALVPLRAADELYIFANDAAPWRIVFDSMSAADSSLTMRVIGGQQRERSYSARSSWRGLDVQSASGALEPCGAQSVSAFSGLPRAVLAAAGKQQQVVLLQFGGPLDCNNGRFGSIALPGASFGAVKLVTIPGIGFGVRRDNDVAAKLQRGNREIWLTRPVHELRTEFAGQEYDLRGFIAGFTKYEIKRPEQPAADFKIVPTERSHRVLGKRNCDEELSSLEISQLGLAYRPRCQTAPQAKDSWLKPLESAGGLVRGAGTLMRWWVVAVSARWHVFVAAAVGLAVCIGACLAYLRRRPHAAGAARLRRGTLRLVEARGPVELIMRVGFIVVALAIVAGYIGWKRAVSADATVPMVPWPALAAWAMAAIAVATAREGGVLDGLIVTAWTVLIAVGHVALVSLTLSSGELRTLRFADDTTAAIALMAAIVMLASQLGPHWIAERVRSLTVPAGSRGIPVGLKVCFSLTLIFLIAWFLFGSEAGIAGVLQPSEAIKTFTIVALAASVTVALERDRGPEGTPKEFRQSLLMIVALLGVILAVPVSRNDLSPFLILIATSVVTFFIVVIVHWTAICSERLMLSGPHGAPPPDLRRRRSRADTALQRFRRTLLARIWRGLRRFIGRPEPWIIGACVVAIFSAWYAGTTALADARATRQWLMSHLGGSIDKPIERVISWLEFNARPDHNGVLEVEFADVGLQVSRSRDAIAFSRCGKRQEAAAILPALSRAWAPVAVIEHASSLAADWMATRFLPSCITYQVPEGMADQVAARMPAVQNDFVSTWLIVRFGRDGATGIVLMQCVLLSLMLLAGFLAIRWSPGQIYDRPAAATAGFVTIGFAVTLGLQWTISWHNALGLLPVMGQPSTFLSHGPSHTLLFGTPAVLSAVLALRMRGAFRLPKSPARIPRLSWWHIYPR
jgi:cell division protein FtsW (lipid II flippase)